MGQGSITRKASDLRPLLLDRFRNAAAAYSLRPLTLSGQDNPVVKVRRSVDNTEQDFNPAQINDGTLEQFVNAGDVAPADYGTGAAAAYSLRHVSDGYTGDVVRVRRSVDNTEQDFNPTEIEDGTLVDWVTALDDSTELVTNGTFDTDISGWSQTASGWVYGTNNVTNTTGSNGELLYQSISTVAGQTYLLTFDVVSLSGTLQVSVRDSSVFGTTLAGTDQTTTGSKTYIFTAATTTTVIRFGDYFTSCTLDNISVKEASSGFVTTWYDQSGNSNDATQATAASQPKIVSGGSLVTENGKPAIDFDGDDDSLLNSTLTANSTQSVFYVKRGIIRSGSSNILGFPTTTNDTQIGIYYWNSADYEYGFNTWVADSWGIESATSLFTKQTIEFALFKDGNPTTSGVKLFIDSVEQSLSQVKGTSTSRTMADGFRIGTGGASFSKQDYDGLLQEIIVYPSDQSSNRELIETNVNHYYSIYSQTNDGFVTTWYDQSGNGNHATQATAASQPKIVSAGSLVVENGKAALDFDGSDDFLQLATDMGVSQPFAVSAVFNIDASEVSGYVYDNTARVIMGVSGENEFGFYAGSVWIRKTNTISGQQNLSFINFNGASSTHNINGTTWLDGDGGSAGITTDFTIGQRYTDNFEFDGTIQELLIYPTDQSTKRQQIESNINTHYGIY